MIQEMEDNRDFVTIIGNDLAKAETLRDYEEPSKWVTGEDLLKKAWRNCPA